MREQFKRKGVIKTTERITHMDNFKLLSIIATKKIAINKDMYTQIKADSRAEKQYNIVERVRAVFEASRDISEGYGARKRQDAIIAVKAILDSYKSAVTKPIYEIYYSGVGEPLSVEDTMEVLKSNINYKLYYNQKSFVEHQISRTVLDIAQCIQNKPYAMAFLTVWCDTYLPTKTK